MNLAMCASVLAVAVVMQGCASTSSEVTAESSGSTEGVSFPDAGRAWLKGGSFVDVEQLRRMGPGMTKDQVRLLIGDPHFDEGIFGVREWNYLFNFRTGKGAGYVTCQYMVHFNGDGVSTRERWKNPDCAQFIAQPTAATSIPAAPIHATPVATERFRLNADALFAFGKSGGADILPEGRRQIETLASKLKDKGGRISKLTVIGFTDRLGSSSYNQSLSLSRANTVREILVQYGVERSVIRTSGEGANQPVVTCRGSKATPALVNCLQPNRRVEIEVQSEQ
ncbi:outer membrane protein assembly factor BamE domain-containing protein [Variovorax sp. W6]|uniref:outer membrane protein assembly factor BamE domain-containing protein n=1 Tax=Variovorax sp. W6 TaxID=3093895 RepID=UPI003D806EBC